MTIHCIYNTATNALLGVSEAAIEPEIGQSVRTLPRDLPDFAVEYWNPAILLFQTKEGAQLSKKEFFRRWTPQEYAAAKALAAANGQVDYYWQLFILSDYISVSDPDTVTGVQFFESVGVMAQGRATEILA